MVVFYPPIIMRLGQFVFYINGQSLLFQGQRPTTKDSQTISPIQFLGQTNTVKKMSASACGCALILFVCCTPLLLSRR